MPITTITTAPLQAATKVTPTRRRPGAAADPDFAATDATSPGIAALAPTPGLTTLTGLLDLQEREAGDIADRKGRKRGNQLLDSLADLQRALLTPAGPDSLTRLAQLCQDIPQAADAGLQALLQSVTLRARIELLRRGIAT